MEDSMNKREFTILEKVFAVEVNGGMYQGKCKVIKKLENEGYVQFVTNILKGFPPVKVEGYVTTIKGNAYYCMNCDE
jgi:hypothetical protein